MELQEIVDDLAAQVPGSIGAVLCDFEGETVVLARGDANAPDEAEDMARDHLPKAMALTMPVQEFLLRLGGAEPCGLLRMFGELGAKGGAGQLTHLELRYETVDLLVDRLPNDFYLVLVLRRPAVSGVARHAARIAARLLSPHVE